MLFDVFSNFEGAKYTIEGNSYTADELRQNQEEFTAEKAKKQLKELIREREQCEKTCGTQTPILFRDRDDRAVYIKNSKNGMQGLIVGNAFLIALGLQEYGIVRELAGRVRMEDGSLCYFDDDSPINWTGLSIKTMHLLDFILKKDKLPEDVRVFLIESMVRQSREIEDFYMRVQWPIGNQEECLSWSKELVCLKKYPELYEKLMTEEFICSYLWRVSAWYDAAGREEQKAIVKKMKSIAGNLRSTTAMWEVVKYNRTMISEFGSGWYDVGRYMKLWKKVSNRPIVLSVKEDKYWTACMEMKENLNEYYPGADFISTMVENADYILDADTLKKAKLFEYFFHEGKEAELYAALKINLLTKKMMPAAVSYAEKNNQLWTLPMLIMKAHGEFAEADYEE